jgi:5-methylcytosine-specific restriction endonuclease McrA
MDEEDGERFTSWFADKNLNEFVPYWLADKLKYPCPDLYPWENEIAFEIGVALAPDIRNLAEFQIFVRLFTPLDQEEGSRILEEMRDVVERYEKWIKQAFREAVTQHRKEEEHKRMCVLCLMRKREDQRDICIGCRKEYWAEEQRLKAQLYRARKAGTPATLTLGQWITTLKRHQHFCAYCQTGPYEVIEHYIPIKEGGGTTEENCIPSCRSCNSKKQGDHPEGFN